MTKFEENVQMKKIYTQLIIAVLLGMSILLPVHADVALDGTTGNTGGLNLQGPAYKIKAEYGHQSGANLFHSFQRFNINTGESATFSGPASVQNIIGRVTGGEAS